ncbi:MAG TPA: glycosyltransferase [Alphaproteobacteria bacterium]|nr:glycosyltransferase [Alphaproteobacteria bacterium]
MPAISVIIPVYNVERFLRRCLNSVLNQTFSNWEAICVNDGSPDNSAAILEEYAARDKRFKVITKTNGGLSDARNVGMQHATGKYVLYLDSDDSIHPQTMEFTYGLAEKNNADVVNFRKDLKLRTKLLVKKFLKKPVSYDEVATQRMKKKYSLNHVCTKVTDEIIFNSTERSHRLKYMQVKHCYVWQNLYRREFIKDIPFIKGIIMEDFPWWSEVMIHRPRVVITRLPFYLYMPDDNNSIMASSKRIKKALCVAAGIKHIFPIYRDMATDKELNSWGREFLWPYIIHMYRDTMRATEQSDRDQAKEVFNDLYKIGVFDNPKSCKHRRYQKKIFKFLGV